MIFCLPSRTELGLHCTTFMSVDEMQMNMSETNEQS